MTAGGVYGNANLAYLSNYQYVSYTNASEQSASLDPDTAAVDLLSTTDCYVAVGTNPTSAAPSGEKVKTKSFLVTAAIPITIAVPRGTDAAPIKVAVIRSSADGTLHINERKFT